MIEIIAVIAAAFVAFALFAVIRVGALAERRQLPTTKQLRAWRKERLDLNPAMRRRS